MIARCGDVRVHHWGHRSGSHCDPWKENETEWHRAWKNQFPIEWQEVFHRAESGERHVADIKTDQGWVIEFQHSPIDPAERLFRDTFYRNIIWVVNGARRKRDWTHFQKTWEDGKQVDPNTRVIRTLSDEYPLLREWGGGLAPVFFDFGEHDKEALWWIFPKLADRPLVGWILRVDFLGFHAAAAPQVSRAFEMWLRLRAVNYMEHVKSEEKLAAAMRQLQALRQNAVPRRFVRRRF